MKRFIINRKTRSIDILFCGGVFFQIHTYVFYGLSLMNSDLSVFHLVHVKGKRRTLHLIPTLFAGGTKLVKKVEHSL